MPLASVILIKSSDITLECGGKRSDYGVRRQSEAATALWMSDKLQFVVAFSFLT
jgi:hypothetical protein